MDLEKPKCHPMWYFFLNLAIVHFYIYTLLFTNCKNKFHYFILILSHLCFVLTHFSSPSSLSSLYFSPSLYLSFLCFSLFSVFVWLSVCLSLSLSLWLLLWIGLLPWVDFGHGLVDFSLGFAAMVMGLLIGGVARWGLMRWCGCWWDRCGGFLDRRGCQQDRHDGFLCGFFFFSWWFLWWLFLVIVVVGGGFSRFLCVFFFSSWRFFW